MRLSPNFDDYIYIYIKLKYSFLKHHTKPISKLCHQEKKMSLLNFISDFHEDLQIYVKNKCENHSNLEVVLSFCQRNHWDGLRTCKNKSIWVSISYVTSIAINFQSCMVRLIANTWDGLLLQGNKIYAIKPYDNQYYIKKYKYIYVNFIQN